MCAVANVGSSEAFQSASSSHNPAEIDVTRDGLLFRAKAAGSLFCARMPKSAARPIGLKIKDEITAKLNKPSFAALLDNKILAKQSLKEVLAPAPFYSAAL